jgi:Mrp family chromosome partitioning ATPase
MSEPDARILARAVDGVLLVLQVGSLRPAQLRVALDALTLVDAPLLGVVLDGAEDDDGARGGQDASRAPGIVASTATAPAMPPGLRERDAPPAEAS